MNDLPAQLETSLGGTPGPLDLQPVPDRSPSAPEPELTSLLPQVELIEEDGENLESDWHRLAMNLLIEIICFFLRDREDFYAGGNMFIYFNEQQARDRDFRGPDFFFVWGVNRTPMRRFWAVWQEGGRYPNVIIELLSPRTAREDLTTKRIICEQVFRTPDYFCYDPDAHTLHGWHLANGSYEPLTPNDRGWLWCGQLGLWLGTWEGLAKGFHATWLRWYDANGQLVPSPEEAAQQRAASAEAELARLRELLVQKGIDPVNPEGV